MVRYSIKILLLTTILITACQSITCAENNKRVEILNDTGHIIESLYIAPEGNTVWGKDFAAETPFEVFQWKVIKYSPEIRYFKLKVTLDDGREFIWAGDKRIDFNGAQKLILYSGKHDALKYAVYRLLEEK